MADSAEVASTSKADQLGNWENFPAGLRVMAVDDDPCCLKVIEQMLKLCKYEVTTCTNATAALQLLRDRAQDFDLVLSDVYMPDMDGFKLLETIGLELDTPVIMMSSNGDTSNVLRGVTHGAVDFLIKPVRIEELRNVWQHVVRKKKELVCADSDELSPDKDEQADSRKRKETSRDSQSLLELMDMGSHKRHEDDNNGSKKPRVVWSVDMHQQFVNAVNQLGIDKAVPKKILELMNVDGLTRENVASHLQKYRLYLKRVAGVQPPAAKPKPSPPTTAGQATPTQIPLQSSPQSQQQQQQQHQPTQVAPQALQAVQGSQQAQAGCQQSHSQTAHTNVAQVAQALPQTSTNDALNSTYQAATANLMTANPLSMSMATAAAPVNPLLSAMAAGLNPMAANMLGVPGLHTGLGFMGAMAGQPGQPNMGLPNMLGMAPQLNSMPGLGTGMPLGVSGLQAMQNFMQGVQMQQQLQQMQNLQKLNGNINAAVTGGLDNCMLPGGSGMNITNPSAMQNNTMYNNTSNSTAASLAVELAMMNDPTYNPVQCPSPAVNPGDGLPLGMDNDFAAAFDLYEAAAQSNEGLLPDVKQEPVGPMDDLINFFFKA